MEGGAEGGGSIAPNDRTSFGNADALNVDGGIGRAPRIEAALALLVGAEPFSRIAEVALVDALFRFVGATGGVEGTDEGNDAPPRGTN